MYDIIHCCVAGMSPLALSTTETMGGKLVNLSSAMNALVWSDKEVPSLRPTATRVVSSSSCSPKLGTGSACNQAPDLLLQTARSLAHYLASCARGAGGGLSCPCIHELKASALAA